MWMAQAVSMRMVRTNSVTTALPRSQLDKDSLPILSLDLQARTSRTVCSRFHSISAAQSKRQRSPSVRSTDRLRRSRVTYLGTLQVQGGDILRSSLNIVGHTDFKLDEGTLSWNWSQRNPLDFFTANTKLNEFLDILTPAQIRRRETAFKQALRFINNAAAGGGTRPVKKSFNDRRDKRYPDARYGRPQKKIKIEI